MEQLYVFVAPNLCSVIHADITATKLRGGDERNIQRMGLKTPCFENDEQLLFVMMYLYRDKKLLEPVFIYSNKMQLLTCFFTL